MDDNEDDKKRVLTPPAAAHVAAILWRRPDVGTRLSTLSRAGS